MVKGYYIYNNYALVAKLLFSVLKEQARLNLAIVAAILPLALDESICALIETQHFSLLNVLKIHKNKLVNYNDQYSDALPIMVNGISILLDLKLAHLNNEYLEFENNRVPIVNSDLGLRANRLKEIFLQLYKEAETMQLFSLYKQLNIKL